MDLGWVAPEQGVRFGKGGKVQPMGPQITITQIHAEHSSEVTVTDPAAKKSTRHAAGIPDGTRHDHHPGLPDQPGRHARLL